MNLKTFQLEDLSPDHYWYIVHLFDDVLIGEITNLNDDGDDAYRDLKKVFSSGIVLEAHIFNEKVEIYTVLNNGKLVAYTPMLHRKDIDQIPRCYELEKVGSKPRWGNYQYLEVVDYVNYDENDHYAYVEQTILRRLIP